MTADAMYKTRRIEPLGLQQNNTTRVTRRDPDFVPAFDTNRETMATSVTRRDALAAVTAGAVA